MQRASAFGQNLLVGLFGVVADEVGDAVHQRMTQALRHTHRRIGRATPSQFGGLVFGSAFGAVGHFDQTLTRVRATVQHHVFHPFAQRGLQVVVHTDHARVDDAHVHARLDRVVQEHGVDGLAHRVVTPEAEGHVGHATRHLGTRQILLDPARGFDEVHRIVVVLFDAGGDGKNVRVKNDVFGWKAHLVHQHAVSAFTNLDLAFVGVGLAFFVKRHDHGRCAIALNQLGLAFELVQAFFHADRVDDALALNAAQTGFDHRPFARIHHHRHAGDVGLTGHQIQKPHHGRLAVEHGFVHVHVDDLRAVFDLLTRHSQSLFVLAVQDHAGKGLGAGHVGALTHVDKQRPGADGDRLQTGQLHGGNRHDGRRDNRHRLTLGYQVSVVVQDHSDIERPQA